jgi:heptosyltransferase-1
MKLLVIKTSSLGDILQTLPAVSDACRARHGLEIDWVVETPFAPAPAWHPRVRAVIPVNLRRWRREPSLGEMGKLIRDLRSRRYDLVIDAQGLMKSALLGLLAKGPVAGLDFTSAREGVAAIAYGRRFAIPLDMHAVERTRRLFAATLGYDLPEGPADYGLPPTPMPARPRLLMLHGATWVSKRWPEEYWSELARLALGQGVEVALRWHDEEERASTERIAAAAPGTLVLHAGDLQALRDAIAGASVVAANDSGPAHLAAALGVPGVTVYGSTRPAHNGTYGAGQMHLAAEFPCSPCRSRTCLYRGPAAVKPACYASLPPARVWDLVAKLLSDRGPALPGNS